MLTTEQIIAAVINDVLTPDAPGPYPPETLLYEHFGADEDDLTDLLAQIDIHFHIDKIDPAFENREIRTVRDLIEYCEANKRNGVKPVD